LTPIFVIF